MAMGVDQRYDLRSEEVFVTNFSGLLRRQAESLCCIFYFMTRNTTSASLAGLAVSF
ncbi:MAG: hypothetical protein J0H78_08050 [Rhizobiales bacterium]|nr:hypothetical protein [Hyphomicrobiales bacterium]